MERTIDNATALQLATQAMAVIDAHFLHPNREDKEFILTMMRCQLPLPSEELTPPKADEQN